MNQIMRKVFCWGDFRALGGSRPPYYLYIIYILFIYYLYIIYILSIDIQNH